MPRTPEQGHEGLSFANALRDSLTCGVIALDAEGRTALLSVEAAQILALSNAALSAVPLARLPAPLPELLKPISGAGQATPAFQVELMLESRGPVTLRVSALPLALKPGAGAVVVLKDITAARQVESHLEQLDRLANIGTLAATMAHEIKNALVAGKTFVELLLEKHQDAELVEIVRRELGRIDAIVSRMLRFAGPRRAEFSALSVHDVIEHSLRLIQPKLNGKQIKLECSFQATPDVVNGDDYELQQAFVNLLLNAHDAMGQNGTLTIATQMERAGPAGAAAEGGPALRVRIQDSGAGIAPEHMGRLFQPFFTTKPGGTGLGLAITRRIIEQHRGAITAESRPGQGTTFDILLPAARG